MENGKLLQEIHNTVTRLETESKETAKKLDKIAEFMEPEGVCEAARGKIKGINTQIKFQWWLIALIVVAIIGGAFKILSGG